MSEYSEKMPFNKVGTDAGQDARAAAEREGISEEEWRAQNLPTEKLEFRWRYDNRAIPLFERRLRSLGAFNVGPAVQAWIRSRLEWVRDNRFYDMPEGVIVLSIDPEGVVDIRQEQLPETPARVEGTAAGTPWRVEDKVLYVSESPRHAADTFVRDLASTLGWQLSIGEESNEGARPFVVSDEFGIIANPEDDDPVIEKLVECFDKLWTQGS